VEPRGGLVASFCFRRACVEVGGEVEVASDSRVKWKCNKSVGYLGTKSYLQ